MTLKVAGVYPALFGVGSPLLDLSLKTDAKLLKKYKLEANKEYSSTRETLPLFDEISKNSQLKSVPGGSSQIAIRAFQWLSDIPKSAGYTGSVADDKLGDQQRELMLNDGVDVQYYVAKGDKTGRRAALVTGTNTTLVTDVASASKFDPGFLFNENLKSQMGKARVVYVEGGFLDVSVEALLIIAHRCNQSGNYLALNLSAESVIGKCSKGLQELLPFVSYLFCNADEARELADKVGWFSVEMNGTKDKWSVTEIAKYLALYPKADANRARVVVITQGKDDVVLAALHAERSKYVLSIPQAAKAAAKLIPITSMFTPTNALDLRTYPVPEIPAKELKDTVGCGDSFVGGFFAALLLEGKSLDDAVNQGIWTAGVVARHEGATFGDPLPADVRVNSIGTTFRGLTPTEIYPRTLNSPSTPRRSMTPRGSLKGVQSPRFPSVSSPGAHTDRSPHTEPFSSSTLSSSVAAGEGTVRARSFGAAADDEDGGTVELDDPRKGRVKGKGKGKVAEILEKVKAKPGLFIGIGAGVLAVVVAGAVGTYFLLSKPGKV